MIGAESMQKQFLQKEAATCRKLAREFAGRPERPFLLKMASAMEELALLGAPRN